MKFGSNDFFEYIANNVSAPNNCIFYQELCDVIKRDLRYRIKGRYVPECDMDIVLSTIYVKVIFALPDFVRNSESKSEAQRNSWLILIMNNAVNDYFKKTAKQQLSLEELSSLGDGAISDICGSNVDDTLQSMESRDALLEHISAVCELDTTPDKIISFFLNCFICVCVDDGRVNGSPQQICDEMNDRPIREVADIMKARLQAVVSFRIPNEVYSMLDAKIDRLEKKSDGAVFFMTSKRLSDSSCWVRSKLEIRKGEHEDESY